ncbi:hypothetical protein BDV10DRAFT_158879 [Aspergillus recurvatus]
MRFISFRHGYDSIRQAVRSSLSLSPAKLWRGIESNLLLCFRSGLFFASLNSYFRSVDQSTLLLGVLVLRTTCTQHMGGSGGATSRRVKAHAWPIPLERRSSLQPGARCPYGNGSWQRQEYHIPEKRPAFPIEAIVMISINKRIFNRNPFRACLAMMRTVSAKHALDCIRNYCVYSVCVHLHLIMRTV